MKNEQLIKNAIYTGSESRESLVDLTVPKNFNGKTIVFLHGFMGFKDWGCWNLVENFFVDKGFASCKYNVSHNGGTTVNGIDFPDPEAFSMNTYRKEKEDLAAIIQWLEAHFPEGKEFYLIGHSRGGGTALLGAAAHPKVKKCATWAGISSISDRFPTGEVLDTWKKDGVRYVHNGRTKQDLPNSYFQYKDFLKHSSELDIEAACKNLNKPVLVIHGTADESVSIEEGRKLANWLHTELVEIDGANHTFGSAHPWNSEILPVDLEIVCGKTLKFF
jgi:pimeloyl-ACP methyl ester carboxylesterase